MTEDSAGADAHHEVEDVDLMSGDDNAALAGWLGEVRQRAPDAQQTAERLVALLRAKRTTVFCLDDADRHFLGDHPSSTRSS